MIKTFASAAVIATANAVSVKSACPFGYGKGASLAQTDPVVAVITPEKWCAEFDINRDGSTSFAEAEEFIQKLGTEIKPEEAAELLEAFKAGENADGVVVMESCRAIHTLHSDKTVAPVKWLADLLTDSHRETQPDFGPSHYEEAAQGVFDAYDRVDPTFSDNRNPRADFAGCILRTTGHDWLDFRLDDGKGDPAHPDIDDFHAGGMDGCINLQEQDNAGIAQCLARFHILDAYHALNATISIGDYFSIAAEAAMGRASSTWNATDPFNADSLMGKFRDGFKFGRKPVEDCEFNTHRMPMVPNACGTTQEAIDGGLYGPKRGLKQLFNDNIFAGRTDAWALTAAINGVHTVGSAHIVNSGFEGHWSDSDNQGHFNNDYFISMMRKGWGPNLLINGNEKKNQWSRADLGQNDEHKEMMLNTDLCLAYTNNVALTDCQRNKDPYTRSGRSSTR